MISLDSSQELGNDTESDDLDEDEHVNTISQPRSPQLRSFVWQYFKDVPGNPNSKRCSLCNLIFANKSTNLARHLLSVHKIRSQTQKPNVKASGRRTSSIIWKYCKRINDRQALCQLCNKLFYFGGGNTTNMTKHLRRKHAESIECFTQESPKKDRKTTSYVWDYVTKQPNNQVRCTICLSEMSFHGTANLIKHLSKHKIKANKTSFADRVNSSDPLPSCYDYDDVNSPRKDHFKCQMCNKRFDHVEGVEEQMSAHIKECHNMESPVVGKNIESIDECPSEENGIEIDIWKEDNVGEQQDSLSIVDEPVDEDFYNALIEEDVDDSANLAAPLDSEATTSTLENPPSIETIGDLEDPDQEDKFDMMTIVEYEASSRLFQLKEELLRQQTNYFNEKAAYYRMQKYLVALQVKKERLEIEMLSKNHSNQMMP